MSFSLDILRVASVGALGLLTSFWFPVESPAPSESLSSAFAQRDALIGGSSGTGGGGKLFVFGGALRAADRVAESGTAIPAFGAERTALEDRDRGFRLKILKPSTLAEVSGTLALFALSFGGLASVSPLDSDSKEPFCFELLMSPNSS